MPVTYITHNASHFFENIVAFAIFFVENECLFESPGFFEPKTSSGCFIIAVESFDRARRREKCR